MRTSNAILSSVFAALSLVACPGGGSGIAPFDDGSQDFKPYEPGPGDSGGSLCGWPVAADAGKYDSDCKGIVDCTVMNLKCKCGCQVCGEQRCATWTCNTDCQDVPATDTGGTDTAETKLCGFTVDKEAVKYNSDCKGNTGCSKGPAPECNCVCKICSDELCVRFDCDPACPPDQAPDVWEDPGADTPADNPVADEGPSDTGPADPGKEACPKEVVNPPTMGKPCEKPEDCGGCGFFCYDDPYMGSYKICSRDCLGDCGDGFACVTFSAAILAQYGGTHLHACMPACSTDEHCWEFADFLVCAKKDTKYQGITVGGPGTCQVPLE